MKPAAVAKLAKTLSRVNSNTRSAYAQVWAMHAKLAGEQLSSTQKLLYSEDTPESLREVARQNLVLAQTQIAEILKTL